MSPTKFRIGKKIIAKRNEMKMKTMLTRTWIGEQFICVESLRKTLTVMA